MVNEVGRLSAKAVDGSQVIDDVASVLDARDEHVEWFRTQLGDASIVDRLRTLAPVAMGDVIAVVLAVLVLLENEVMVVSAGGPAVLGPQHLTTREREVLRALATGATNKDIALVLAIAPKTVMHHSVAIYRKLGVRGRTEAAALAMRKGWSGERSA